MTNRHSFRRTPLCQSALPSAITYSNAPYATIKPIPHNQYRFPASI
nr:hypothetical protein [uncultured Amphritea sp.]